MEYFNNPLKFHDSEGNIKRFLGLELEISDFNRDCEAELKTVLDKWSCSVTQDGSINGGNPFELRTAPARGEAFVEQMRQICRVLRKGNAKANESCGLHVHIDARDLEPMDLVKIASLWPKVEDRFYDKTFKRRGRGGYAMKWTTHLPAYKKDYPLMRMYDDVKAVTNRAPNGRMMGMNFQAYLRHNTFENRIHHGTINITKILNWAKMNSDFFDIALSADLKNLEASADRLATTFPVEVKAKKPEPKPEQIIQ